MLILPRLSTRHVVPVAPQRSSLPPPVGRPATWSHKQNRVVRVTRRMGNPRRMRRPYPPSRVHASTQISGGGWEDVTAIVIGSGIAGLLAARIAAKHFDHVYVVDKDPRAVDFNVEQETLLQTLARRKRWVPHIVQPHQLTVGGVKAMDTICPGFEKYALQKGALSVDICKDVYYYDYGGLYPRHQSTLLSLGVSRRFVEQCLRDLIVPTHNITFLQGVQVEDLLWSDDGTSVRGVVSKSHGTLQADVTINATGRGGSAKVQAWLEKAGYPIQTLRHMKVFPHVSSVSCFVRMPDGWLEDPTNPKTCIVKDPTTGRGGTLLPTENKMWQLTLGEFGSRARGTPPIDATWEGLLEFARTLPDPMLAHILAQCSLVPDSTIQKYDAMMNTRVYFEEMERWPEGFVTLGDSVQALNAVYGQGMTVCAQSVETLGKHFEGCLRDASTVGEKRWLAKKCTVVFQKEVLPSVLKPAWDMATTFDLRYETTTTTTTTVQGVGGGGRPAEEKQRRSKKKKKKDWKTEAFAKLAQRDQGVYYKMMKLLHLVDFKMSAGYVLLVAVKMMRHGLLPVPRLRGDGRRSSSDLHTKTEKE